MAAQIRSNIAAILRGIKTQLVTKTGLSEHLIFMNLRPSGTSAATHPVQSGSYLRLFISSPQPIPEWFAAAGRVNSGKARYLDVAVRTRLGLDTVDREDNHLLDTAEGHFILEDQVFDALEGFQPVDTAQNVLTAYPIAAVPPNALPSLPIEPRDPHWAESQILFLVPYNSALDQTMIF